MSEASPLVVTLDTRFGSFQVCPEEILTFPAGLPGFESNRRFVLLSSEAIAPLQCLHAVDGELPAFLVIDPNLISAEYRSTFAESALAGVATPGVNLVWLALITLCGDNEPPTVNLRAPVIINPEQMIGAQIVSSDRAHLARHALTAA